MHARGFGILRAPFFVVGVEMHYETAPAELLDGEVDFFGRLRHRRTGGFANGQFQQFVVGIGKQVVANQEFGYRLPDVGFELFPGFVFLRYAHFGTRGRLFRRFEFLLEGVFLLLQLHIYGLGKVKLGEPGHQIL
ncbi:MAG: hypothetical protein LBL04_15850 [Bacteroidales bacterium]|nr:hypothetical protein [Bacteroidales bacterium]